jgi:hypothetical protein
VGRPGPQVGHDFRGPRLRASRTSWQGAPTTHPVSSPKRLPYSPPASCSCHTSQTCRQKLGRLVPSSSNHTEDNEGLQVPLHLDQAFSQWAVPPSSGQLGALLSVPPWLELSVERQAAGEVRPTEYDPANEAQGRSGGIVLCRRRSSRPDVRRNAELHRSDRSSTAIGWSRGLDSRHDVDYRHNRPSASQRKLGHSGSVGRLPVPARVVDAP